MEKLNLEATKYRPEINLYRINIYCIRRYNLDVCISIKS